jgi:chemotaxis protein MotB
MARRRTEQIHVNHERWLVSYADFITLLFAFFVVMYSISQVNQGKYKVLSETLTQAFNAPTELTTSSVPSAPVEELAAPTHLETQHPVATQSQPSEELNNISDRVNEKFAQLINDKMIKVSSNEFWLQIELNDSILFPSAGAEPSQQAQTIFTEIAGILKNYTNSVQIEGFTDNLPIRSDRYPTNWELSAARAAAIVKWLVAQGVQPERLAAVGYGEFQPVSSNTTEAGRAQNRRVAVMIAKRNIAKPRAAAQ